MNKKILNTDADWQYNHVIFKTVSKGHASDRGLLCKRKRKMLLDELLRFLKLYSPIEMLGFCIISDQAHCIFAIPKELSISLKQVASQYEACYDTPMDARSHKCHKLRNELNNISKFAQRFARDFTITFNSKSLFQREGSLWGSRFQNITLYNWKSLAKCWSSVELSSVKAGLVTNPIMYGLGLWGAEEPLRTDCLKNFHRHFKRLSCQVNQSTISYDDFLCLLKNMLAEEEVKFN